MRKGFLVLLLPLLAASPLLAGGFNIYEFGGRASALGGAVVARSWDASTAFYNPSGLAFLKGTQFYAGTTLIFPFSRFVGASPIYDDTDYKTKNAFFYPVGVYFTHKFTDEIGAGLSLTNPFGLGLEWEDANFPGRGLAKNSVLQSFYISPTFAYQITPNLSLGFGPDLVIATVKLERSVYLFTSPGSPGYEAGAVSLEGTSDLGFGFSYSMMYRTEKLGLGFLYRHAVHNKFSEGKVDFTIKEDVSIPNAVAIAQSVLKDQNAVTSLDFPDFLSAGVYYKITDKLGAEVDYMWYNWSVFDKIELRFDDPKLDQTIEENYKDSWQLRVGTHYELTDKISLRAGYIFDQTPQPIESVSPLLPDNDRHDFSFGVGYNFGKYQVDLGYMLVESGERSTLENGVGKNHYGFDGAYTSRAHLFFGSFGINF